MRKFAQHFLINHHAVDRIVSSMKLDHADTVLEIGPGRGALTSLLIPQANRVVAIEVDAELVTYLKERFGRHKGFEIIQSDVMKFDFGVVSQDVAKVKVIGNLPYNLTSPILRKLCDWNGWSEATIMVQKEVGDRLAAQVGSTSYGALTVGMSLTCEIEKIFDLLPTSFKPPPRVKSSVLKLRRRERALTTDIISTQRVIQAAFQQRRKTIINSLSHGLNLTKEQVQPILRELNIQETVRPEQIDIPQFVLIAEKLKTLI